MVILFKNFSNLVTVSDFCIFFFKNLLANIGLRESATKLDITTADANVIAVWVKRTPVIPLIKIKGINTATKTTVVAMIANETCFAPLYAATNGLSPNSILLTIFSNITIASSTTIPIANTKAIRVNKLIEKSKI